MAKKIIIKNIAIIVFLFCTGVCMAQEGFPVPAGNANQLFYLQRTPNTNTVVYELNYDKNGELDTDNPVHVFWIRYGEKGQRAELSFIQRHFAYGIKTKLVSKDLYEMHIVSYKKRLLYLRKTADNTFYVYTMIDNKQVMVNRIFLKIN